MKFDYQWEKNLIKKYLQNNRNSACTLRHDIQYIQVEISKASDIQMFRLF